MWPLSWGIHSLLPGFVWLHLLARNGTTSRALAVRVWGMWVLFFLWLKNKAFKSKRSICHALLVPEADWVILFNPQVITHLNENWESATFCFRSLSPGFRRPGCSLGSASDKLRDLGNYFTSREWHWVFSEASSSVRVRTVLFSGGGLRKDIVKAEAWEKGVVVTGGYAVF